MVSRKGAMTTFSAMKCFQWGVTECIYDGRKCLVIRGNITDETLKNVDTNIDILIIQKCKLHALERKLQQFKPIQILVLNEAFLSVLPLDICSYSFLSLLDISNNLLCSLPHEIVELTSLTVLDVSKNCLEDIDVICGLSGLQFLDVTENKLTKLPRTLWKLKGLQSLSCSSNQIAYLPEEVGYLKCLTILRVNNNKLSSLPRSFSKLTDLLLLQLDGNYFDHIPSQIFSCTSLLELSMSNNVVEGNLPARINSLSALRTLNLARNRISGFPSELEKLECLEYLNISDNPVKKLSLPLAKLLQIQELSAAGCGLSCVPDDLGLCCSLIILDLSGNKIDRLANESFCLAQLTSLCLAYNIISSLPVSICELRNLVVLELQFNKLNSLPEDFWCLSRTLRQLDLGHNAFETIPLSIFHSGSRLSYLCLDSNPISEVPNEISNLKELTHLSVSDCSRLVRLPEGLGLCSNLRMLKVAKNKLSFVPKSLAKLESLKYLDLSNNDFENFPLIVCFIPRLRVLLYDQGEGRPLLPHENTDGWYRKSLVLHPETNDLCNPQFVDNFGGSTGASVEDILLGTPTIKGLPSMIENLIHLVHLSLQSNGLYILPDVFHNMKLQRLNVSHNRLHHLPPNFHNCKCLTHLYLHNNNIGQLDQNFRQLRTLRVLTLQQNPLVCPPVEVGSEKKVLPVFAYLKQQNTYEDFILKSLCQMLIDNFPKESTHSLLRKIGFSDSMIESLEKQFPGGYNHVKRLKIALEAWSGFSFVSEILNDENKTESYSSQQINDSKNFTSSGIPIESDDETSVADEDLHLKLIEKKDSLSSSVKLFKKMISNSSANPYRLLHIIHLIGLDDLHSKLLEYFLKTQQVRF
ncbi:unnamed protein product [Heterobilharzia americana]|nr:unnamed protein product [Heterobilharzia americana]